MRGKVLFFSGKSGNNIIKYSLNCLRKDKIPVNEKY